MSFYPESDVVSRLPLLMVPRCGACGLLKGCNSPKMPVSGRGKRGILVVGEAPGREEDNKGIQFVGETGGLLQRTLSKLGVDMREDCWLTNALICRPPNNTIDSPKKVDYCRPNLINTINELNPMTIILLGASAVRSLIRYIWPSDDGGKIGRWVKWNIPCQQLNCWVCPTWHPSYVIRMERKGKANVIQTMFERHIKKAVSHRDRPYHRVPDYRKNVETIFDTSRAAKIIREMIRRGGVAAFDYEADRLKPDMPESRIICCSVCWEGKRTIAFPWQGKAITAMREFVRSDLLKIASNIKFEHRWTLAKLGVDVENWHFDQMLGAHVLDNRSKITSIKFQSFVLLGQPPYNESLKGFIKGKGGNGKNRLDEVGLETLLLYCGMDSYLEYLVAQKQMAQIGFENGDVQRTSIRK